MPSCLADVAECHLYIGVLGLRYGYVPRGKFPNPEGLSITELEYLHAGTSSIPRLMVLKSKDAVPFSQTDAKTKEHPPERIEEFRQRAGSGEDQRPANFSTVVELREKVLRAFHEFERRHPLGKAGNTAGLTVTSRAIANDTTRRGYIEWLAEECEKVVLLGLGARDRQDARLGQVYVPAVPASGFRESKRGELVDRAVREQKPELLLARLGRESIYVPGAPGSGKSTFCKWGRAVGGLGRCPDAGPSGARRLR